MDGVETRKLLHRLLLVSHGAALRRRGHEYVVGSDHYDFCVAGKGAPKGAVVRQDRWNSTRCLGLDHDRERALLSRNNSVEPLIFANLR